jgi:hypothetical protein
MKTVPRIVVVGLSFLVLMELLGSRIVQVPVLAGYVLLGCVPCAFAWASWPAFPRKRGAVRVAARLALAAAALVLWITAWFGLAALRGHFGWGAAAGP